MKRAIAILFCFLAFACTPEEVEEVKIDTTHVTEKQKALATFAGGCFWCMEGPFEQLDGVFEVLSGFSGGEEENPSYEDVAYGKTGHVEAIQIIYDPSKVSYEKLLEVYWKQVDPTDEGGQFVDRGHHYTTAIFYHDEEQRKLAEASKDALDSSDRYDKPIVTRIEQFTAFYQAEEYHQDYYKKNPIRYKVYRTGSGRDRYLESVWGDEVTPHG